MEDEHRKKLNERLTPIHLYKLTPKTNCGECGHLTCLAFSTQVIAGQAKLLECPYLDEDASSSVAAQLEDQHRCRIGVSREGFEKTLEYLRQEVEKLRFQTIAESLGAELIEGEGKPALGLTYFGEKVIVTDRKAVRVSGGVLNPWEQILLYNYLLGGASEPSGTWVGMESLPNSISKVKSLRTHCEERVAQAFAGKVRLLSASLEEWERALDLSEEGVDFAGEFQILPKLHIRVLFWDEDPEEGFGVRVKFLFDSRVLHIVDLESLVFASEQLTDRILERSHSS